MDIAIIGGGFAGLAVAHFLINTRRCSVTIFDPRGPGEGTSGLASGLLHTYTGRRARLTKNGEALFSDAIKLLECAQAVAEEPIYWNTGLLRLAITSEQLRDFRKVAEEEGPLQWWEAARCEERVPGLSCGLAGLWIPGALQVDTYAYLQALWKSVEVRGGQWKYSEIEDLRELDRYHRIILTAAYDSLKFPETTALPLKAVKGQILYLEWPEHIPTLPFPLSSVGHLLMLRGNTRCLAGASYERGWTERAPDPVRAQAEILAKITPFFPAVAEMKLLDCKAGLRAYMADHQPLLKRCSERLFVLAGLGSKGLLYHASLAKRLVELLQ